MWADTESDIDYLNFSEVAETAADIISMPEMLPISIGIFGDWGAGKSTILKLTEAALNRDSKKYIHIHFDAWLYQGYDDARASILEAIAETLIKHADDNTPLLEKAKSLAKRVDKIRALGVAADIGAISLGIHTFGAFGKLFGLAEDALETEDIDKDKQFSDGKECFNDVRKQAKGLLKDKVKKSPPKEISAFREEYSQLLKAIACPIVVYIDNLDRCTPINAIHTLEAIRLFLFLPNTAFVIAADEEMIRSAVVEYHKGATQRHQTDYLDKLIQVPINVPKPGILEVRAYLFMLLAKDLGIEGDNLEILQTTLSNSLRNAWKEPPITLEKLSSTLTLPTDLQSKLEEKLNTAERIAPLLVGSSRINGNPRIVKRLLNVIKMRKRVSDRRDMNLDESLITKLVIFERCAGKEATKELYRQIDQGIGYSDVIKSLENSEHVEIPDAWKNLDSFIDEWIQLPPLLKGIDLRAAAYLSRETMPLGIQVNSLSTAAKDLIQILMNVKTRTSQIAKDEIGKVQKEEYLPIMEVIVTSLRSISDWGTKPQGLDGAILLSNIDKECKTYLFKYLSGIKTQRWLGPILTELNK
jgi:predicted KAP-like P-loop ATPase